MRASHFVLHFKRSTNELIISDQDFKEFKHTTNGPLAHQCGEISESDWQIYGTTALNSLDTSYSRYIS